MKKYLITNYDWKNWMEMSFNSLSEVMNLIKDSNLKTFEISIRFLNDYQLLNKYHTMIRVINGKVDYINFNLQIPNVVLGFCKVNTKELKELEKKYIIFYSFENPYKGVEFNYMGIQEVYKNNVDKKEYPDFSCWISDMIKSGVFLKKYL